MLRVTAPAGAADPAGTRRALGAVSASALAGRLLEREGGRKGKELRMGRIGGSAYLPLGVSPRKGRARLTTGGTQ